MDLTTDADRVLADLVSLGAVPTSGHRTVAGQAYAMACNVSKQRAWIGQTYRQGAALQAVVDRHPEWVSILDLARGLYQAMLDQPAMTAGLSHHLLRPSPCFDLDPASVNEAVRERLAAYAREQIVTKVLWREGGLDRCHVEVGVLPENKVVEV